MRKYYGAKKKRKEKSYDMIGCHVSFFIKKNISHNG